MDFIMTYLLISLPKFYIFILFSFTILGYGFRKYKFKILYISAVTALVSDLFMNLNVKLGLVAVITFITALIMYYLIMKINWILAFFMAFTSFLVLIIPEMFIVTITSQLIDNRFISDNLLLEFFVVSIESLLIFIVIYILNKKKKNLSKIVNEMENNKILGYWLQLFFLIIIQIYLIIFLNYTIYIKKYKLFNDNEVPRSSNILILSVVILFLYVILFKIIINLKNKYADIVVSKTENDYNKNLEKLLVKLKIERHDNISQVQAIYGMVEEEKYYMLKEYLNEIVEDTKSASINHIINIKNIPISAFLHTKMESIDFLGIDFRINVGTSDQFKEIKSIDLVKIVCNILENAIRAVSEYNIKNPYIELYWGKKNDDAIIKITNNGPEISKELIASLFKEGYTTKRDENSGGYGLVIVKSIIDKYKGNIEVVSNNSITSFTCTVPLK